MILERRFTTGSRSRCWRRRAHATLRRDAAHGVRRPAARLPARRPALPRPPAPTRAPRRADRGGAAVLGRRPQRRRDFGGGLRPGRRRLLRPGTPALAERSGLSRNRPGVALPPAARTGSARAHANGRDAALPARAGRGPLLLRAARRVRQRGPGPRRLLQLRDTDRPGWLARHRRPARPRDTAGIQRPVLPAAARGGSRQRPVPRILRGRRACRGGREPVPAPVPGLDRRRVRHPRVDRFPLRTRAVGRARRAGGLLRRRLRAGPARRVRRRRTAVHARGADLVRPLLLRRNAPAGAGVRRGPGLRPRARGGGQVLRARGGRAVVAEPAVPPDRLPGHRGRVPRHTAGPQRRRPRPMVVRAVPGRVEHRGSSLLLPRADPVHAGNAAAVATGSRARRRPDHRPPAAGGRHAGIRRGPFRQRALEPPMAAPRSGRRAPATGSLCAVCPRARQTRAAARPGGPHHLHRFLPDPTRAGRGSGRLADCIGAQLLAGIGAAPGRCRLRRRVLRQSTHYARSLLGRPALRVHHPPVLPAPRGRGGVHAGDLARAMARIRRRRRANRPGHGSGRGARLAIRTGVAAGPAPHRTRRHDPGRRSVGRPFRAGRPLDLRPAGGCRRTDVRTPTRLHSWPPRTGARHQRAGP